MTILGAGPAGLATAWELSRKNVEHGGGLYDITVYDMSWRPGGKCASGRTDTADRRIVQNGTHYVFGVYRNMFQMLGEAYAILNGNAA
ncbi:MAG TPA: NAD(P)-binding protein, partial [Polyangiales bacterium]|nr:NAD(P)-binding protein [Polyangiales bacterium]